MEIDKKRLKIKWRDPASMAPNARNHREHPEGQREVMRIALGDEGWIDPVIYNKQTGVIVDGHLRVEEAIAAGVDEVPVIEIDVDEITERKILVRHDRISALADIDMEMLVENAKGLEDLDVDMEDLGWDSSLTIEPVFGPEDEPPALPPPPVTGEDDRLGRFLLIYSNDAEREEWLNVLGLPEFNKIAIELDDLPPEIRQYAQAGAEGAETEGEADAG